MKKNFSLIFLFLIISIHSQTINNEKSQLWIGIITNTKINQKFSWWNDTHFVPQNFGIVRTGLTYNFNNRFKNNLTAGVAYAVFYPLENQTIYGKEWRPWLQGTMNLKDTYFDYLLRLRYEARLRAVIIDNTFQNEFNFNNRIRLMLQARHFFGTSKNFYWMISDEVLFNFGNTINNKIRLDQNRISGGIGYKYHQTTFQLDYMNQMILSNKIKTYTMNHNLQLLIFHNFNF
jgi:Protein of unknown function (DUF2490)